MGSKAASAYTVPVIDLSNPDSAAVAMQLWDAATTVGWDLPADARHVIHCHSTQETSVTLRYNAH